MPGGGRGRGWGRQGGPRRTVRFIEPALLLLLRRGPSHGYTLLARLGEFGMSGIDPSAVYRVLREMETRGWTCSDWDEEQTQGPPRRVYRLAPPGREVLTWWTRDLRDTRQVIDRLLAACGEHENGPEGRDEGEQ